MPENFFGIDLGTTTTLISKANLGQNNKNYYSNILYIPQKNASGEIIERRNKLESFFYYSNNGPIVGLEAFERGPIEKIENCLSNVKRKIGKDIVPWEFDGKIFTPSDVSALYIDYLIKNSILKHGKIDGLTVTVPASFNIKQKEHTIKAIEKALNMNSIVLGEDIKNIILSEPISALLGYLSKQIEEDRDDIDLNKNPLVLVYDIGGGTLDLTIVEVKTEKNKVDTIRDVDFKIKKVNRFTDIAGSDFDEKIARYLLERFIDNYKELNDVELSIHDKKRIRAKLINLATDFKENANNAFIRGKSEYITNLELDINNKSYGLKIEIEKEEFAELLDDFINNHESPSNVFKPIEILLEKTNINKEDIDYILMVGGMSEMQLIQEKMKREFGEDKVVIPVNETQNMVALGASIYSALRILDEKFISEPPSDAYYLKLKNGFKKVLGTKNLSKDIVSEFRTTNRSRKLLIQLYAGEDTNGEEQIDEKIISTFIPLRRDYIDLGREYEKGTDVTFKCRYEKGERDRVPQYEIIINNETVKVQLME